MIVERIDRMTEMTSPQDLESIDRTEPNNNNNNSAKDATSCRWMKSRDSLTVAAEEEETDLKSDMTKLSFSVDSILSENSKTMVRRSSDVAFASAITHLDNRCQQFACAMAATVTPMDFSKTKAIIRPMPMRYVQSSSSAPGEMFTKCPKLNRFNVSPCPPTRPQWNPIKYSFSCRRDISLILFIFQSFSTQKKREEEDVIKAIVYFIIDAVSAISVRVASSRIR